MAIIENVQIGGVDPATTRTGKSYWKVRYGNDQAIMVFDYAQAEAAKQFIGQYADIETAQNGNFTNFVAIRAAAGGALAQPAQTSTPRGKDPEVEARIVRQSSMATASRLIAALYAGGGPESLVEAEAAMLELAARIYAKAFGSAPAPTLQPTEASAPAPVAPAAPTATVVEQVNQVLGADTLVPASTIKW